MKNEFSGKTILITGGSSGIGEKTAIIFAKEGSNVVIADINKNETLLDSLKLYGVKTAFYNCDVSNEKHVKKIIHQCTEEFGELNFAFNNAGTEGVTKFTDELLESEWDKTINTNLKGVWLCLKHQIPVMKNVHGASIVNCSSVAGLKGFSKSSAYVASKHGVIGLTKSCAIETAEFGLRINAICPGVINTPMIERVTIKSEEAKRNYENLSLMKRLGQPEEIAETVLFLMSSKASFITGTAINIDGGLTCK
jgi:NAD(P)-dependent dehydrogenase (short-subunit alcohol dehydrogenase family)